MGTYGDDAICPHCGNEKAVCQFRNNLLEDFFLICNKCGLHLHCEERKWVPTRSFIDTSVIDMNLDDVDIDDMIDEKEGNENIVTEPF